MRPRNIGPLSGLRVVDFSRVLAGPFCTSLFSDVGADVIKVEPPGGDDYRHIGPFVADESALFKTANRGKRSVVLDLKTEGGRLGAVALARTADVVVENFRPGVADKLGIGYSDLSAENKKLIYLSISGFGQHGPMRDRPAYDLIVQAMSGLMSITGAPDGPPTMVGESFGDLIAGLYGAWAVTTALWQRERANRGCHIDLAMFDALLSMLPTAVCRYAATGEVPQRVGNRHPLSAPFGVYRTADGHVAIAVLNEKLFEQLAVAIEQPELALDPRYKSDPERSAYEPTLRASIERWSCTHASAEVVKRLSKAGVPVAPIMDVGQAVTSEQAKARELFRRDSDGMLLPEQPVHFSGFGRGTLPTAPKLGEHGPAIMASLALHPKTLQEDQS
jgi:CoA:oxalate CoA-transferase